MPNIVNSIEFNKKLSDQLDKKLVQESVVGIFADNALKAKFIGAQTVLIPNAEMTGMGDYDREKGFAKGAITIKNTPFTLQMDRSITFNIDDQDMDESGVAETMAGYMAQFVEEHAAPEVDAYTMSKLAALAVNKQHTVAGTPASQAYKMITEAIAKVQNKIGYNKKLVAFVDSTFYAALMNTPEIARHITVGEFKHGEVSTKVKMINDVAIIPVTDDRMKTAYDFHSGSVDGSEPGGFEPQENAQSIGLLVLPQKGCSLVKKTEKTRIFTPEQNLNADAWKGDYRVYYDALVKKSYEDAIYAYTY